MKDDPGIVDPWHMVNTLNIQRRQLTVGQRGFFFEAWRIAVEAEKKSNLGHNRHTKSPEILPDSRKGDTRDKLGAMAGVSGRTMDKVRTVKQHAPEAAKKVATGEISLEAGYKEAQKVVKAKAAQPTVRKGNHK